ncbi:MAG: hypothetical protein C4526_05065 [Nitrospiraceae bacterium]|nr:MAG: hypothetical protein C4526_05065 [Nitrospiraceae bacterium]
MTRSAHFSITGFTVKAYSQVKEAHFIQFTIPLFNRMLELFRITERDNLKRYNHSGFMSMRAYGTEIAKIIKEALCFLFVL